MSVYFNAFAMLVATVGGFLLLAKLVQTIRSQGPGSRWRIAALVPATASRLAVEQTCVVDAKRRLLLIRCDEHRVLLLTGGPADLVVSRLPATRTADVGP